MGLIDDLILDANSILGIRDDLGVALKQVYFVTRTWSGTELGAGTMTEVRAQMLPTPRTVEFKLDTRIREGGYVKAGDVMLKMVSKQTYTTQASVDCLSVTANVEKYYELGGELYRPVGIVEKHITWSILLRRISDQVRP